MKHTWLVLVLASLVLASMTFAQSSNKLQSDLLVHSSSRQLADDILALAGKDAQPSRRVVVDFTDELARTLIGKRITAMSIGVLSNAIVEVLQSDGVPTGQYRKSLDAARAACVMMNYSSGTAQRVVDLLRIVGQEVRGPEDLPVNNVRVPIK